MLEYHEYSYKISCNICLDKEHYQVKSKPQVLAFTPEKR